MIPTIPTGAVHEFSLGPPPRFVLRLVALLQNLTAILALLLAPLLQVHPACAAASAAVVVAYCSLASHLFVFVFLMMAESVIVDG